MNSDSSSNRRTHHEAHTSAQKARPTDDAGLVLFGYARHEASVDEGHHVGIVSLK